MAIAIHLHLILLTCLVWLGIMVASTFSAPLGALFSVSISAQLLVFAYGILLYNSWLEGMGSRWLRPAVWWLPQTVFFTIFDYDPVAKVLGRPIGGFCAAMPLQLSASAGWHLDHSSLAVGFNLLAAACALWAVSLPYPQATAMPGVVAVRLRGVRGAITGVLLATPTLIFLVAALVSALGITTWVKRAPPQGLEQVVLASGKVVPVTSVAPVQFQGGGSLLLLEYFTDLPPAQHGRELAAEAHEVWERFRPFVEKSGYRTAVIAVSSRPAKPVYVAPHLKKFGWSQEETGQWHEIIPESPR